MTNARNVSGWLPTLLGPVDLQANGQPWPSRRLIWNFTGGIAVTDHPNDDDDTLSYTEIAVGGGGGGGTPGGDDQQMQYNDDGALAGTEALTFDKSFFGPDDGAVVYTGKHVHAEYLVEFPSQFGYARTLWPGNATNDDTPTDLGDVLMSAIDDLNCIIVVIIEIAYAFSSSGSKGGNRSLRATFARTAGVITKIDTADSTNPALNIGAAVGADIVRTDDNTITIQGTGIADTIVTWTISGHVIVSQVDS